MGAILQHEQCDHNMQELNLLVAGEVCGEDDIRPRSRLEAATARADALAAQLRLMRWQIQDVRHERDQWAYQYGAVLIQSAMAALRAQNEWEAQRRAIQGLWALVGQTAKRLLAALPFARDQVWTRPCCICDAPGKCRHREAALIPIWRPE